MSRSSAAPVAPPTEAELGPIQHTRTPPSSDYAAMLRQVSRSAGGKSYFKQVREIYAAAFGVHAKRGRQTLDDFVVMEAAHDLNHLRQVQALLRRRRSRARGQRATEQGDEAGEAW